MPDQIQGEEKLRIVLESIIRNVPKDQQCEKYGVTEQEFETWRETLMRDGGKIYDEPDPVVVSSGGAGLFTKLFLALSVLANIVLIGGVVAWKMGWLGTLNKPEPEIAGAPTDDSSDSLSSLLEVTGPASAASSRPASPRPPDPGASVSRPSVRPAAGEFTPTVSVPSDPRAPMLTSGGAPRFVIDAFGMKVPGRNVVFALDLSDYMTGSVQAQTRFRALKTQLRAAVSGLSVNARFNLLLFRGLREVEMLGRTSLPANQENKSVALAWLRDIGEPAENEAETRNRHYTESDLLDRPPEGVVGPWYALAAAMNFDPGVVFVLTGDCSSLRPGDFSPVDRRSLNLGSANRSAEWEAWRNQTTTLRLTAVKWLRASKKENELLPIDAKAIETLALQRLGLSLPPEPAGSADSSWPWKQVYDKFQAGLRASGESQLPITHFIVTLPEGGRWPADLTEAAREFARANQGGLTFRGGSGI